MTLTKERTAEMLEAAKPLMKWLNETTGSYPYSHVIVDNNTVVMVEEVQRQRTDEFLKD